MGRIFKVAPVLFTLFVSFGASAKEVILQCNEVEITDKVTLRSKGGDKTFFRVNGESFEVVSKKKATKLLLAETKESD